MNRNDKISDKNDFLTDNNDNIEDKNDFPADKSNQSSDPRSPVTSSGVENTDYWSPLVYCFSS